MAKKGNVPGRVKNVVETVKYRANKTMAKVFDNLEETKNVRLEEAKEKLEYNKAQARAGVPFAEGRAIKYQDKVAKLNDKLYGFYAREAMDRMRDSTSAEACFDRFTNDEFRYATLGEMIKDRTTIEAFRPKGKSSFDSAIQKDKLCYGKGFIGSALDTAKSGEMVSTIEEAKIVLALGDAKILGQRVIHENGNVSTYGQDIVDFISSIREEERKNATDAIKTKDDMEIFNRNDEKLATLQEQATIISSSAQEYYASLMQQLGSQQEQ